MEHYSKDKGCKVSGKCTDCLLTFNRCPENDMVGRKLTKREIEIIQLIADGNSNKMIVVKLGIREPTVKNTLMNIRTKLIADTTAQAVAMACREGIIR